MTKTGYIALGLGMWWVSRRVSAGAITSTPSGGGGFQVYHPGDPIPPGGVVIGPPRPGHQPLSPDDRRAIQGLASDDNKGLTADIPPTAMPHDDVVIGSDLPSNASLPVTTHFTGETGIIAEPDPAPSVPPGPSPAPTPRPSYVEAIAGEPEQMAPPTPSVVVNVPPPPRRVTRFV